MDTTNRTTMCSAAFAGAPRAALWRCWPLQQRSWRGALGHAQPRPSAGQAARARPDGCELGSGRPEDSAFIEQSCYGLWRGQQLRPRQAARGAERACDLRATELSRAMSRPVRNGWPSFACSCIHRAERQRATERITKADRGRWQAARDRFGGEPFELDRASTSCARAPGSRLRKWSSRSRQAPRAAHCSFRAAARERANAAFRAGRRTTGPTVRSSPLGDGRGARAAGLIVGG